MQDKKVNSIERFIFVLQANGTYAFSVEEARKKTGKTEIAVKRELDRLKQRGSIVSVRKGFYTIVPPEYSHTGLMPPELFIHPMMQWLQKPYYIGLLSAASLFGAAHQQPQELFVITSKPALRTIEKKSYKIRFFTKNNWPEKGISDLKTDTGYVKVSSPELTCIDLVSFHKTVGGLNRIVMVIRELLSELNPANLKHQLQNEVQTTVVQRLGYILSRCEAPQKVIQVIHNELKNRETFWVPLMPGKKGAPGCGKNAQWKIVENITVEPDL